MERSSTGILRCAWIRASVALNGYVDSGRKCAGELHPYAPSKPWTNPEVPAQKLAPQPHLRSFRSPHGPASARRPGRRLVRCYRRRRSVIPRLFYWPATPIRAAKRDDAVGAGALAEISSEINRQNVRASIDAGVSWPFTIFAVGTGRQCP